MPPKIDYSRIPTKDLEYLQSGDLANVSTGTLEYLNLYSKQQSPKETGSFMGDVNKRVDAIKQDFTATRPWDNPTESIFETIGNAPGRLFRTAGNIAGVPIDALNRGIIKPALKSVDPNNALGSMGQDLYEATPPLQWGAQGLSYLSTKFPAGAANAQAGLDLFPYSSTARGMVGAVGKEIGKDLSMVGSGMKTARQGIADAANFVSPFTEEKFADLYGKTIKKGFDKAVKPSAVGKSDSVLTGNYYKKAGEAVSELIDNSPVRLSQSKTVFADMSKAIHDNKLKIWNENSRILQSLDELPPTVDYQQTLNAIQSRMIDPALNASNPGIRTALEPWRRAWDELINGVKDTDGNIIRPGRGRYGDPIEAEAILAGMNNTLNNYWRDPTMHSAAGQIAEITDVTRKSFLDAIPEGKSKQVDILRKKYGAMSEIEKDIANRALKYAQTSPNTLSDKFSKVYFGAKALKGVVTSDPAAVAEAVGALGAKGLVNAENDAANIMKKMFKEAETLKALKSRYIKQPDYSGYMQSNSPVVDETLDRIGMAGREPVFELPPGGQMTPYIPSRLDIPKRDATLTLPGGQTFEIPNPPPPALQNAYGEGFTTHPAGLNEGVSGGRISRDILRELIKKRSIKRGKYIQPGY